MKIAVVADKAVPPWSVRQIILALEYLGASAIYVRPSELVSVFGEGDDTILHLATSRPIEFNGVILRDLGSTITLENFLRRCNVFRHLELLGIPVINPVDSIVVARDKYYSLLLLNRAGLPVPKTLVTEDFMLPSKVTEQWSKTIIKPVIGSMGFGIVMTENPDVTYTIARTLAQLKQPIYLQRYIEKPGRDIRILVVGNEIVAAYYRVQNSKDEWKTNIAQGAKPIPITKLSEELHTIIFKVMKVLKLHYAGIDVAETEKGYVIFEVNASPQWRGIQKATGINPALHLARYVLSLIKR
ncbi:MAG: RimK family alpha-L-glutamate ligase [Ignisphaera sp.]|uniref:RimK family alpha-L-glutamate ligase n=1 Tax=Ignisphaera aggregans TaxID=334771 RepID=A0A7J3MWI0_9CREN